ncbi:signal recognition particle 19 kDa protein [Neocloeon triangulifer]|uniref:signal recognition particle 19 kDa protein n=1 Tax=Neocloeon triangulifer TaxID=2078957 RepID=UPI00286EB992|nr:signal recognition particle 19 kDa protein [Neocloeon triangulifer]
MSSDYYKDIKHSDRKRWICIYPAYLNSKKTRAEGRKVPLAKAVDTPTVQEMRDVLQASNVTIGIERSFYSRERSKEPQYFGRVRVHLKNDDGTPLNPEFPTRDSVLLHLGEMIPKLKTRTQQKQNTEQQASQSAAASSSKKKGKGRR